MNIGIRRVGIAIMVLVPRARRAAHLSPGRATAASSPTTRTTRASSSQIIRQPRGEIVTADGVVLAKSVPSNDEFRYQRVYPPATAKLFAQVVGYQSIQFGSVGVEAHVLVASSRATTSALAVQQLPPDLRRASRSTGTVVLTLSAKAQLPRPRPRSTAGAARSSCST